MKGINAKTVLRSAERMADAEESYKETKDPLFLWFLRRESGILLRRAMKIWLRLRFRRVK